MSEVDDWAAAYLRYVDRLAGMIPYSRVGIWKEFFFNPSATVRKDNIGVAERMKDLYVGNAVELLIGLIAAIPVFAIVILITFGLGIIYLGFIAAFILASYLLGPIISFLYSLLEYVVAKALGGVGSVSENFNASTLPGLAVFVITIPLLILQIPFTWLAVIPIISLCASIIAMPLSIALTIAGLYGLYLKYLAMKEVHKLSSGRAAAVVVIPIIATMALLIALFILLYIFVIAAMLGSMGAIGAAGGLLRPH